MSLPNREWGTGRLLYVDSGLSDQMTVWRKRAQCVAGFHWHRLTVRPYPVRNLDGKVVAVDPTVQLGRCDVCGGGVVISPDLPLKNGTRSFGMNGRCRASVRRRQEVTKRFARCLNDLVRLRGNRPLVPRDAAPRDHVIRSLGDEMYANGAARRFRA